MFMLHGRLAAKPGRRDELLQIFASGDRAGSMPGCRLYLVAVDEADPDGVWVTEVWESAEAHQASLQLPHVKEQIAQAMPVLDMEGFRRQELDAVAGVP